MSGSADVRFEEREEVGGGIALEITSCTAFWRWDPSNCLSRGRCVCMARGQWEEGSHDTNGCYDGSILSTYM